MKWKRGQGDYGKTIFRQVQSFASVLGLVPVFRENRSSLATLRRHDSLEATAELRPMLSRSFEGG